MISNDNAVNLKATTDTKAEVTTGTWRYIFNKGCMNTRFLVSDVFSLNKQRQVSIFHWQLITHHCVNEIIAFRNSF